MTRVALAEDHDVIQAFSTGRANQPLRMPSLPGCSRCNRVIPDAHRRKTFGYGMAVGDVAVAYEMDGCTIPREGLGDLAGDPLRCGIGRHAERYQPPPVGA